MNRVFVTVIAGFLTAMMLGGCTPRAPVTREQGVVLHQPRGCVVTILLDLSGSFQHQMVNEGKAYEFCLAVVDEYFRDRIGENDELVIAQISAQSEKALLWQGTPSQLRTDFSSPEELAQFLQSRADPYGSNVFQNMASSVEYLASDPDVTSGNAKSALLVLSDMLDNDLQQDASRERLRRALATYSQHSGIIGCYFVDQRVVPECRQFIASTGIQNFVVESEIIGNPQLPVID